MQVIQMVVLCTEEEVVIILLVSVDNIDTCWLIEVNLI